MESLVIAIGSLFPASMEATGTIIGVAIVYLLLPIVIFTALIVFLLRRFAPAGGLQRLHWSIVGGLVAALVLILHSPVTISVYHYAIGTVPQAENRVAFENYGARLKATGPISPGLVAQIKKDIEMNPLTTSINLSGKGGEISSARELRDFIDKKALNTFVEDECSDLCAIAFLGGTRRFMTENAKIGFAAVSVNGWPLRTTNAAIQKEAVALGVTDAFMQKYTTTTTVTYATPDELLNALYVTDVIPPGDEPRF